jgi:hypothetical protein
MKPIMALALGVSLGAAFEDMHRVTEMMCTKHRSTYVVAMATASVLGNSENESEERGGRDE